MINKACKRTEKHQKLIVIGDFNAETSYASKNVILMAQLLFKMKNLTKTDQE